MARRLPRRQNSVESGNVRSFGRQVTARTGRSFEVSKVDSEFPNLEASLAEVRRLREENARLRSFLIEHCVRIPEIPSTTAVSQTPRTISAAPDVRRSALGTAEQRIELFRSLFRGRDDVYAIRWESADGRSGYMPKADRDWKSYLRAKDKDRKRVDRQTRRFRPLTQDVVRGHLVGDHTVGIYPLLQNETCWLLAVDFDKKTWQKDAAAFLTSCRGAAAITKESGTSNTRTVSTCGSNRSRKPSVYREEWAASGDAEPSAPAGRISES